MLHFPGKEASQTEMHMRHMHNPPGQTKAALGLLVDPAHQRVLRPEDLTLGTNDSTKHRHDKLII